MSRRTGSSGALIAFLGPSLPAAEAREVVACDVRPPARQGDLFRALTDRPAVIALIDGVFEASPSVWHHEILAALAAGVTVVGGGSMGALRAAELHPRGMIGVGAIFEAFASGVLVDDAEVALLHASAEHGFRPLSVPLVNVRHAAHVAQRRKVLSAAEARALVSVAEELFYQERRWADVLGKVRWPARSRARWDAFARTGLPDLKAADARACLRAAGRLVRRRRPGPTPLIQAAHVRRRRLREDLSGGARGAEVLAALERHPEARILEVDGTRRKLLVGWARECGISVDEGDIQAALDDWLDALSVPADQRQEFLARSGLDDAQARTLAEELALEAKVVERARWMLSDGPAPDETLAFEARVRGIWAELAVALRAAQSD